MLEGLKVIQITDCHISAGQDAVYRGINPRETLESLLPGVRALRPDLLLLTGDLAEDGSAAAYDYLADTLESLAIPFLCVPGNHDDITRLLERFPETAVESPLVREHGGWQIILLNSAVVGEIPGSLSQGTISGLGEGLKRGRLPTLVVLHHQPVVTGSPWIDRYPLLQPGAFWSALDGCEQVKAVAWGHIHHEFTETRNGVRLLGSPATSANSLKGSRKFNFDPGGPACRWLMLAADGAMETGILRQGD